MSKTRFFHTGVAMMALSLSVVGGITAPTVARAETQKSAKTSKQVSGSFKQVTHATKGSATVKGRTLTLSNFETSAGPKLHVYLVRGGASSNAAIKAAVAGKKFVDLGALKNLKGAQTYAVPASAQTKGSSIVIWCDKFDVAFGSAALS
jgi:hypothetical protein